MNDCVRFNGFEKIVVCSVTDKTSSSAVAEKPRDASCLFVSS